VAQVIRPALEQGRVVVSDRFLDSSLAYQGVGRGLGVEPVRLINDFAVGEVKPDRTLLLRVPIELARARKRDDVAAPDRLEREDEAFFVAIAAAYEQLAAAEPGRFRTIDAAEPPARVLEQALAAVSDLLGHPNRIPPR
jgi:dTMP kinase